MTFFCHFFKKIFFYIFGWESHDVPETTPNYSAKKKFHTKKLFCKNIFHNRKLFARRVREGGGELKPPFQRDRATEKDLSTKIVCDVTTHDTRTLDDTVKTLCRRETLGLEPNPSQEPKVGLQSSSYFLAASKITIALNHKLVLLHLLIHWIHCGVSLLWSDSHIWTETFSTDIAEPDWSLQ